MRGWVVVAVRGWEAEGGGAGRWRSIGACGRGWRGAAGCSAANTGHGATPRLATGGNPALPAPAFLLPPRLNCLTA